MYLLPALLGEFSKDANTTTFLQSSLGKLHNLFEILLSYSQSEDNPICSGFGAM
jgi:hypothetical protein